MRATRSLICCGRRVGARCEKCARLSALRVRCIADNAYPAKVEARLSIALSNIGFADRGVRLLPRAPSKMAPAAAFASAYCVLQTRALRHKLSRESGPSAWLRSTVARLSAACSAIELQKGFKVVLRSRLAREPAGFKDPDAALHQRRVDARRRVARRLTGSEPVALLLCERAMVRSEGFAPSITGCKPGVILFHQLRVLKKWRPRQESHLHSDLRRVVCDLLHYEDVEDLAGIAPATR